MTFLRALEDWNPVDELMALRSRLDRTLTGRVTGKSEGDLFASTWVPAADVFETTNSIVIRAELPGMTEKDIKVKVENGSLVIEGERKMEKETDEKGYRRIERSYGSFLRTFVLPPTAAPDRITASYNNGVLEVDIAKKEESKPKEIPIDVKKKLSNAA
jgi:HSP20 family protein